MPCDNRVILAAAGSGKTTTIVNEAKEKRGKRVGLVTFTNNAEGEFRKKLYKEEGFVPDHVRSMTWFKFLLRHFIRPYQRTLLEGRIRGIHLSPGKSALYVPASDIRRYNTDKTNRIYNDKIADFACKIIDATDGAPIRRAEDIFDRIYIDEVQDMAGYDLNFIERLLDSKIHVTLVGDHRQATYKTNQASKNRKYGGVKIIDQFKAWEKAGRIDIDLHNHSHRCVQAICDFADRFFPEADATMSLNQNETGHDGVFLVRERDVETYKNTYSPQALRYSRKTKVDERLIYNFGEAKGMTFSRVIIYPPGTLKKFIKTGKFSDAGKDLAKLYVGITRARQSVAIVMPNSTTTCAFPEIVVHEPV